MELVAVVDSVVSDLGVCHAYDLTCDLPCGTKCIKAIIIPFYPLEGCARPKIQTLTPTSHILAYQASDTSAYGHQIRNILSAAAIKGYLGYGNHKFWKRLKKFPTFN
jgi:hypothetical protein